MKLSMMPPPCKDVSKGILRGILSLGILAWDISNPTVTFLAILMSYYIL